MNMDAAFLEDRLRVNGTFYIRENIIDMTYKLDQRRTAFVMAGTVRHICGDLTKETKQYL